MHFDTPGGPGKAVVFGDLEGTTAAELSAAGWCVWLVRQDRRDLGRVPHGVELVTSSDDEAVLPESSVDLVVMIDALEYTIDDVAMLDQARRMLRPGGSLVVRVPRRRRVDWLDARNIYHYLRETTRHGSPLPEMGDGIFRRHYGEDELLGLLDETGFRLGQSGTSGLGLSEVAYLAGATLFRWATDNPRYQTVRRLYGRLDRAEDGWPAGGYYLTIGATRPVEKARESSAASR